MDVVSFAVEAVSENVFGGRINDGRSSEQGDLSFQPQSWVEPLALADSLAGVRSGYTRQLLKKKRGLEIDCMGW
jgi:hypothetical protein